MDHLYGERNVVKRTSADGPTTEIGFESVPELSAIAQCVCDGGEEQKKNKGACEEHLGSRHR